MKIRRLQEKDAEEVSALIATTLRTTNIKDYSAEYIENDVKALQPQAILERASWMHFMFFVRTKKSSGAVRSALSGGKPMRAVCLRFLSCLNTRARESAGKSFKRWKQMNIFSGQSG